jgi:phosphatidyl-myo-inositol alpha-mannosyltransferase
MAKKVVTSPKLKIGLILDTSLDPPDGVQQYVVTIGEWFRQQGHDVHYLVGETKTRQLPNIHSLAHNINVRFNGNRTTIPLPASRRRLKRLINDQQFDVLHVQTPHHPLLAQHLILAAGQQTAVVGTFHILPEGLPSKVGNRLLGVWLRPSLKRLDRLLAVSPAAAAFAQESFGIKAGVLPNVIDYQRFHAALPLPAYNHKLLTILFLGRLVPRKGAMLLLEAAQRLATEPKLPSFRVVICGDGPLAGDLRKFVADNALQSLISFTGFVSEVDKPRYYASADIAVFPSHGGESFGIVLTEAMASGRSAVLAGDNPGYRSVMAPRADLLFDPNDPQILVEKLRLYLIKTTERRRAATWGANYAKQFDVNVVGPQLLSVYAKALRKRRQP